MTMQESGSIGDTSGTASVAETYRYVEAGGYFSYDLQTGDADTYYLQTYFLKEDLQKTIWITVGETVVFDGTVEELAGTYGTDTDADIFLVEILLDESVFSDAIHMKTVDGDYYEYVADLVESIDLSLATALTVNVSDQNGEIADAGGD